MRLFWWRKPENENVIQEEHLEKGHPEKDIEAKEESYYGSWEEYKGWLNKSKTFGARPSERLCNTRWLSEYFDSPASTPSSLLLCGAYLYESDIIMWAIKENKKDVLLKTKNVSYPVIEIVMSVFIGDNTLSRDVPHWWCHSNDIDTYYYFDKRGNNGGTPLFHSATFTKCGVAHMDKTGLEKVLLEACMKEIQRMTDARYALMRREEFNYKWKELNEK